MCEILVCINYLQTGKEVGQLDEERQEDKSDEARLRRRFGYFVPVHEGGDWEALQLLHITLRTQRRQKWTSLDVMHMDGL